MTDCNTTSSANTETRSWQQAVEFLRKHLHDRVDVKDDGRRLVGPGDTELIDGHGMRPDDVTWIDRRSKWGNPFKVDVNGGDYERMESIQNYRGWFLGHVETGEWDPEELRGETLACWCIPEMCHGVVILNWLAEEYEPQQTLGGTSDAD